MFIVGYHVIHLRLELTQDQSGGLLVADEIPLRGLMKTVGYDLYLCRGLPADLLADQKKSVHSVSLLPLKSPPFHL
ncbi:MAG: hypothetical protein A2X93_09235 [Deltaproteobacteria bacterium GWC2_56_8]|nr:MAG: hypothetical protein A2X99_11605 [Deltaproteobacteria bacterium GWB2_55_19]OGP34638.1 MAG: hypothetical protein A2X93_09235 [Deltaproteobacteria bacterium GWC2_56_8]